VIYIDEERFLKKCRVAFSNELAYSIIPSFLEGCTVTSPPTSNTLTRQLLQLFNGTTWDGNLIAKDMRDVLVKKGFALKCEGGWNVITTKGVNVLNDLGYIQS